MKYTILATLAVFIPLLVIAQNVEKLDEKGGFKQFLFYSSPAALKSIVPIGLTPEGMDYYSYTGEQLKIGDSKVDQIGLGFYDNQLAMIVILLPEDKYKGALKVFRKAYGDGSDITIDGEEKYMWDGKAVRAVYEDVGVNGISITILQKSLMDILKDAADKKIEDAAKKL